MKRILIILFLLLAITICFSQRQDRSWVFGYNCGIDFNNLNNPQTFSTLANGFEIATSISDSEGDLLIYLGAEQSTNYVFNIYNGHNEIISGGDNINTNGTFEKGAIIIPKPDCDYQYYIFYTGLIPDSICSMSWCFGLYMSLVDFSTGTDGAVMIKDSLIIGERMEEGIACVKHANGKDWWLLMHKYDQDTINVEKRMTLTTLGSFKLTT